MKKSWLLAGIVCVFSHAVIFGQEADVTKVTILSDNHTCALPNLTVKEGYSILVEKDGHQYLYDVGQSEATILNASGLGKDLRKTEKIMLSHGHLDHTGGLEKVLEVIGHPVEIIAHPGIFDKKFVFSEKYGKLSIGMNVTKETLEAKYKATVNLQKGFYKVAEGVWLTGEVPLVDALEHVPDKSLKQVNGKLETDLLSDDNTLLLETKKGLVVVFACGHRGAINTLNYVKQMLHKDIYAVIGGMHLEEADEAQIAFVTDALKRIFQENQTKVFAPNHCTGAKMINEFRVEFKDIYSDGSCGTTFEF